jgi:hypothetical protein
MLKFSNDPDIAEQQMNAIIFYLTAFGYIDGDFAPTEKTFVKRYIRQLVEARADDAMPDADAATRAEVTGKFVGHFLEVFEIIDRSVRVLFDEVVADEEKVEDFVAAKLKLRCYEIFKAFDADNQRALLATVDELIHADGQVHETEAKFRAELEALLHAASPSGAALALELSAAAAAAATAPVAVAQPEHRATRADGHPFFEGFEGDHYSADPERLKQQAAADMALIARFRAKLDEQRAAGAGRLAGKQDVGAFAGARPFLDGHVYVHPVAPKQRYELIVLGDLHGCYSCLKAALLQADFFAKVEAYRLDPRHTPNPQLVLLGDYIDRGRFSYNGVLRAVMQLFLAAPEHVVVLRGNHEYYIEFNGRIYGAVKPAEAIQTLVSHLPGEYFEAYMHLFEALPNMLLFDRMLFVHAGIPRDKDLAEKYVDLSSLNHADLRFQMLWSDPSTADHIPDELQAQNARLPFGRAQFERFMRRIGCTMMVRGHEKVDEGFRDVYPDSPIRLLNLFSAGGHDNADLPESSSYRTVTPMAATIEVEGGGATRVVPWALDYKRFNDPERNRFFARAPEIEHKG